MLTWIIGLPLATALVLVWVPRSFRVGIRLACLACTLLVLLLSLLLFWQFEAGTAQYQFVTKIPWVPALGISYYVGVDGLSLGLIVMGALVAFAAVCVSWDIQEREKEFYLLLLLMTGGILGAFASLDLFFFYCFHELALVPTFIMIGVWGRGPRKDYATFQITLYLSLGALLALIGLIALYLQAGVQSFDIVALSDRVRYSPLPMASQQVIFPMLLFGFGILVSLWPFHSWAPLGYGSAPTATAMLHAGVLKKFGVYGLLRIALPLLPDGAAMWLQVIAWLCLGNIVYCGLVAMRQKDLNLLIGNSSVAHMGFVFLGIASLSLLGITGAVFVMVAHGLLAALSFGLSGYLYHQTRDLDMSRLGGLLQPLPFLGTALIMAMLAGCGLPGFGNFAGELMVLFGAWKTLPGFVVAATWGAVLIAAVYMLRAARRILHGPLPSAWQKLQDASTWQRVPFVLLLAGLLLLGVFPRLLTEKIKPSAGALLEMMSTGPEPVLAQNRSDGAGAERKPSLEGEESTRAVTTER